MPVNSSTSKPTWLTRILLVSWDILKFIWAWSPIKRYCNKPVDLEFLEIWSISLDPENIRRILRRAFPEIPLQELPTDEEQIRHLARDLLLPGNEKNGLRGKDDSESGACPDSIREIVRTAFFEIMTKEMFADITDQKFAAAEKTGRQSGRSEVFPDVERDGSAETLSSEKTSKYSYTLDMLRDAFPDILDGEMPAHREALRGLVRAIVLRDLETIEPDETCEFGVSEETSIFCIVTEAFPEASDKDLLRYGEAFRTWVRTLASPEETYGRIPKDVRYLLAALNARHLLQQLTGSSIKNALFGRSTDGVAKIFRILEKGCRKGVSPKERRWSRIFLVVLIAYNILPLFAAGFRNERSFIERAFTGVVNVFVAMYFVWQIGFLELWYLFNWSLERVLGGIPFATIYILTTIVPGLRFLYHAEWFTGMNASISATWQIFVQFVFPIRDILSRLWTCWEIKQQRQNGDWVEFDQLVRWELTTSEEFMTSADDPAAPVTAKDVPIRVRVERFIKFTNLFDTGRALEFMLQLLRNYLEGCINVLMDYNRYAPTALRCKKGHREPSLEKFILAGTTALIFGFLCWAFWPEQTLNFISSAYSGAVCFVKQLVIAFKDFQSPERARLQFTYMVASSLWAIFLVAVPYKIDEHILTPTGNMLAFMAAMCVVGFFFLEPIARLIQFCTSMGMKFARWRKPSNKLPRVVAVAQRSKRSALGTRRLPTLHSSGRNSSCLHTDAA
ncbi:hypothetical protein [Rhizobium sp. BT-226]|uniref:hypothetical protein n=1 Tax=Rhizobium sp. BT-226 TaxID=2986922 RepID=UPI0021F717DD|nr:hypothetical protein [Rhizobium sp. BT-226]MCW0021308.1 hypothetical protein [Rhizobium sp. BT-226]